MKNINLNKFTTLYSTSQDAFHTETLEDTLKKGIKMCVRKNGNDYSVTGIHDTLDEARAFNDALRKMQNAITKNKTSQSGGMVHISDAILGIKASKGM